MVPAQLVCTGNDTPLRLFLKTAFGTAGLSGTTRCRARVLLRSLFGRRPPDDEQLADMLYRGCLKVFAHFQKQAFALFAFVAVNTDLDQLVAVEANPDFLHDGFAQPFLADRNDGFQGVSAGA